MENKIYFEVSEDTKGIDLYNFIKYNMKFYEVMDLYTSLKYTIEYSKSLENRNCCDVSMGGKYE